MRMKQFFLAVLLLVPALALAAEKEKEKAADADGPALTQYMGRRIAQTMHWSGAGWLTRETRDTEENTALVFKKLGVKEGMTVCDLGAGNGYYSLHLAAMVG